ncbi:hypothetical protein [Streptacidiphilus anmyonensis]|uniref:hypothetical protein n=1 Tax=Streptacidiphilus anmyonensis TaxID=405782 RepID=UPI0005AA0B6B|nr:hypothetical protein [Streptacidiphilus anmyonensis]
MRYRSGGSGPVDGPDDLWRQAAGRDEELLADAAFPLYAPAAPPLSPAALTEYQLTNGELVKVQLCRGDWFAAAGPVVQVATIRAVDPGVPDVWAALEHLVAAERERLRTWDTEPGGAAEAPAELVVDGAALPAELRREGRLWVARLRPPGGRVVLVVTARGVAPADVELEAVTDLAPYTQGRQLLLNEMALRRAAQRKRQDETGGPAAEEPLGLADHRRLVDYSVAEALRLEADVRTHGYPVPRPEPTGAERRALWDKAVQQQMRLAGEERNEAEESVSALVNQMVALAQAADWFAAPATGGSPEAAEAAVEESIRFTALASEVASAPAQRAWLRQWHRLDEPPFPESPQATPEELRLRRELTLQARASWLDLWRVWFSQR